MCRISHNWHFCILIEYFYAIIQLVKVTQKSENDRVKLQPDISIIGYITDAGEGKQLITRGGNKHALMAQGWNHMKK